MSVSAILVHSIVVELRLDLTSEARATHITRAASILPSRIRTAIRHVIDYGFLRIVWSRTVLFIWHSHPDPPHR